MSALRKPETVRTMRPHRQYDRDLVPFRVLGSLEQILEISDDIAKRIRKNRDVYQVGSYVFADREGEILVVKEGTHADRILRANPWQCVGLYAADTKERRRVTFPDAGQIVGDLSEHFAGLAP